MKASEITKLIANDSGLTLDGKEKKPFAFGTLIGYPVIVYTRSLGFFGKQLKIDFGTAEVVNIKELKKAVYRHKAKDKFFIMPYESNDLTDAIIAGAVGGAGGVLIGDPMGKGEIKERSLLGNSGMFSVLFTIGRLKEQDILVKYREIIAAVESSLKQLGITPPVFEASES